MQVIIGLAGLVVDCCNHPEPSKSHQYEGILTGNIRFSTKVRDVTWI